MIDKITPQIAALYLGQKCTATWIANYKPWVVGDAYDTDINHERIGLLEDEYILIEPHLRRLESITEDEARELFEISNGYKPDKNKFVSCLDWWNMRNVIDDYSNKEIEIGNPAAWLYLLSKGFDLFGLIDAGLAKEINL